MPPILNTIIFPVRDIDSAKATYGALLGTDPIMDEPYYVGYRINGQDVGLDPNGHAKGMTGPVGYFDVDDIDAGLAALVDAGAKTVQEPTDVGGGKRIATVQDADGNVIGLAQNP